jgi:pyruvate kinase
MRKKLLCTLGPSSLNERVIVRLTELGVSLFRLNLSHTKVRDAARIIRFVQDLTPVPLSLDTEGAQIRTGDLVTGRIQVRENAVIRIHRQRVPGDSRDFNLYPPDIVEQFLVGDFVHIDADVLTQVVETKPEWVAMRVLSGGEISQNKAVTVERDIAMPPWRSAGASASGTWRSLSPTAPRTSTTCAPSQARTSPSSRRSNACPGSPTFARSRPAPTPS